MTIHCDNFDDLLLAGDGFSMQAAAQHARGCPGCAEKLASWNEISETARGMRASWSNDMLWPRIERAIAADTRRSRAWKWQIAAALLIFAALGAIVWRVND